MDLLSLKYFRTVAKYENITHAAKELLVAQPSLSKSISALEKELGVPLFYRKGNTIRLNEYGRIFLEKVSELNQVLDNAILAVKDAAGLEHGHVAFSATFFPLLPIVIKKFLTLYPNANLLFFQDRKHFDVLSRLQNCEVDLGFSILPFNVPGIIDVPMKQEEYYLILPPNHRFSNRTSIKLAEVADDTFINVTTLGGMYNIALNFCHEAGFEPHLTKTVLEGNEPNILHDMVYVGLGNAFIPAYWWDRMESKLVTKLNIESPKCEQTVWLSYVQDRYMSFAAQEFISIVTEYWS